MSANSSLQSVTHAAITEADVAGFAAKLEAWCQTLAPGEQALLDQLLARAERAASEDGEIEGYAMAGIAARLARLFAAGVLPATFIAPLAAPMAASAAPAAGLAGSIAGAVAQAPELITQIIHTKADQLRAQFGANFVGPEVTGV